MAREPNVSFNDYVATKEAAATPERKEEMKLAKEAMSLLHAEHFGNPDEPSAK